MKKSDLKEGMVVETNRGQLGMVFRGRNNELRFGAPCNNFGKYMWGIFDQFNEDLTEKKQYSEDQDNGYDILKVYDGTDKNSNALNINEKGKLLWQRKEEKPFPKFMIAKEYGQIVLFTDHEKGTVVYQGTSTNKLGETSYSFHMPMFKDYNGHIPID